MVPRMPDAFREQVEQREIGTKGGECAEGDECAENRSCSGLVRLIAIPGVRRE